MNLNIIIRSHNFTGIEIRGNLSPLVLAESERQRCLKLSTTAGRG